MANPFREAVQAVLNPVISAEREKARKRAEEDRRDRKNRQAADARIQEVIAAKYDELQSAYLSVAKAYLQGIESAHAAKPAVPVFEGNPLSAKDRAAFVAAELKHEAEIAAWQARLVERGRAFHHETRVLSKAEAELRRERIALGLPDRFGALVPDHCRRAVDVPLPSVTEADDSVIALARLAAAGEMTPEIGAAFLDFIQSEAPPGAPSPRSPYGYRLPSETDARREERLREMFGHSGASK